MKKALATFLAAVLALSMTACGAKAPASSTGTSAPAEKPAESVKLTLGIWDVNQEPGMKAMMEKFTEANPNISVEVQVTPWDEYWTKMEAAATTAH